MSMRLVLRLLIAATGGAAAMFICAFGAWLPRALGYCVNITPSEPVGIYELVPGGVTRGVLVLLRQPDISSVSMLRRYIPSNLPLIKRVAAIPSDEVTVNARGVRINGVRWPHSVPLLRDDEGRPLHPYPFGEYRVVAGHVWVMSNHPRGLDSRYFGPMPETNVIARLKPLTTWGSPFVAQMLVLAYALSCAVFGTFAGIGTINVLSFAVIRPRTGTN